MSVNKFTDMTEAELKFFRGYNFALGRRVSSGNETQPCDQQYVSIPGALPASVDWRNKGVITPVKDQGQCGSCWAHATTETIESHLAIATGNLTVLSVQDVTSCAPNPYNCGGTGGCGGSIAELGFNYVRGNGIATETNWPYTATTGVCNQNQHVMTAIVAGCVKLGENNYNDLMNAVANVGPIAVSVDASRWSSYSSGVYDGCDAEKDMDIDHVVQLVGYGTDNGKDYWLVRNSWGPNWGENGYIRLLRHSDGSMNWCQKDTTPSDGSGCDGGPPVITVCGECGIWYDNSYPTGTKYL